ncbi:hypothetical protein RIF29_28304 [Crotalaria pallida]|uniref:Mediator complex subunit 15 KIX domain-containing protein n=1 Tax=Crotalaria pallida TaxID=3830 RepID=A0AAN9EQS4_CROPI
MQPQVHNPGQQNTIPLQQNQWQSQLSVMQPSMMQTNLSDMQQYQEASLDSTAHIEQPNERDWQEEVYQKIKTLKGSYLLELTEMYQKIETKFHQEYDSLPQDHPMADLIERMKVLKIMLQHIIAFLQVSRSNISPNLKEKVGSYEKRIMDFISVKRSVKRSTLQPGQLLPSHMHSMSPPQSQVTQVHSHENQMKKANIQGSVATTQQNNMANQTLLEEVKVNQRLMDTVVDISDENVDPTKSSGGNNTTPTCDCKEKPKAVLHTAGTTGNLGKRFWRCRYCKKVIEALRVEVKQSHNLISIKSQLQLKTPSSSSLPSSSVHMNLMDTNNGTPDQSIEPNVDTSDWRGQLQPESRQRIVDKVMDSLKRHLPVSTPEGLLELRKIAQRFEEKIFTAAKSQTDYLLKISLKMLTMETKSQGTMANGPGPNLIWALGRKKIWGP